MINIMLKKHLFILSEINPFSEDIIQVPFDSSFGNQPSMISCPCIRIKDDEE